MNQKPEAVEEVVDNLNQTAEVKDKVSVGDAFDALGKRGYGPLLFIPAILVLTPLGGITGVPTIMSAIIAVMAVQVVIGRDRLWLPDFLRRLSVANKRVDQAVGWLRPAAKRLDQWFTGRLPALTRPPLPRIAAGLCVILCASVPPLEIIPFAAGLPMLAIALFGLALTLRDGTLMAAGFIVSLGAITGAGVWLVGPSSQ